MTYTHTRGDNTQQTEFIFENIFNLNHSKGHTD